MKQLQASLTSLPDFAWNMLLIIAAIAIGLLCKTLLRLLVKVSGRDESRFSVIRSVIKRLNTPFAWFLPILVLNILLPFFRISPIYIANVDKTVDIFLSIAFAGVLMGVVKVCEDYLYHTYDISKADNLRERKIRTQLQFLRRLIMITIILFTACLILLNFNSFRKFGTSLLAGVGVGSIIIGFAAQKSLGNFLAGFQIAFTQPIRIDDVLIVEGEWGRVEEITLTYVVLKLWDQRNLIIPINYFIDKPFQNWTRLSSQIIGTVFIYLDYTVPIDPMREEVTRLLTATPLWDKRVNVVQVTNASEHTIEVRVLVSAPDSGKAFDLRCYIREGLINFIQKNYPHAFPMTRLSGLSEANEHQQPETGMQQPVTRSPQPELTKHASTSKQ